MDTAATLNAPTMMNGYQIYHSFLSGFMSIREQRENMNRINVFPVADGDTGNNLVRTIKQIVNRLEPHRSASKVLNSIANISLESARGNSGLIFSQYLNGLALNTGNKKTLSIDEFADAAQRSVTLAYEAIETPVEGTILTILKTWSDSIYANSQKKNTLAQIFEKALIKTRLALANTKNQLKVLKENNVIDAGAMGFVSFLEGIELMRLNGPVSHALRKELNRPVESGVIKDGKDYSDSDPHKHRGEITFRYCTEVLLEDPTASPKKLKERLKNLGDSLIVSKGINRDRIHIHTNQPYNVVALLRKYGTITEQKVDDMLRQEQTVNGRISQTAVLTDSIADIPQDILDKYQINVLYLKLSWDEEEYLDRMTITPDQFYKEQQVRKSFPGSSIPSESIVVSTYQYLLEHYENIIVLPVAKSLSGTWNRMNKVAEQFNHNKQGKIKRRISVINTCLNSVGQGLLVREVAKGAAEGKSLTQLTEFADNLKKRIKIYVSVSTFKYMVKGGRVNPLTGMVASLLNLKPIISLDSTGKGKAFDKAFSRKGLMKKISSIIEKSSKTKGIISYAIVHASAEKKANEFSNQLKSIVGKAPDYISEISPIVGMHSGKGAIAIGVIEEA